MHIGTFAGRVGRDGELKKLESGRELLAFSLAVNVGWGDKKATEWVSATVWGERAAKLAPYIRKGDALTIVGRIQSRAYAAKDGTPKAEIVCDVLELTLQSSRDNGEQRQPSAATAPAPAQAAADFDDSDIPF